MQQQINNNPERQKMFFVPKDVFCPNHQNQKVQWLNLSRVSADRLYCNKCERPQNEFIFKYEDVFQKIKFGEGIPAEHYAVQLEEFKKVLFKQFQQIEGILQQLHNFYQDGIDEYLKHCFIHPNQNFDSLQLVTLSEHLSQKLIIQNNSFSFIPLVTPDHQQKLDQVLQFINLYQNCAIQAQRIGLFNEISTFNLTLCRNLNIHNQLEEVKTVHYELAIQQKKNFEISAIDFNLGQSYIAIAGTQNQMNHVIQILHIDKEQLNITRLLKTLYGHQSRIQFLKISYHQIISIDASSKMIFWAKLNKPRVWFNGREFNASMQQINCIQYAFFYNLLVLGGSYLQLWKLNNSAELNPINLIQPNPIQNQDQITCLNLNSNRQKLVCGNQNGKIYIFAEINQNWELSYELSISEQLIRHIYFISECDFISISLGNLMVKWNYFTNTDYEYTRRLVDNIDNAIFCLEKGIMINAKEIYTDEHRNRIEQPIASDLISFDEPYMTVCQNNSIKIYIRCEKQ